MHHGNLMKQVLVFLGENGGIEKGKENLLRMKQEYKSDTKVAYEISLKLNRPVSRQNVYYWLKILDSNKSKTDRNTPVRTIQPKEPPKYNPMVHTIEHTGNCILFVTDCHAPYHHRDRIAFVTAVAEKYQPDLVIHGGDEVDNHALSMHDSDPNLDAAGTELEKARGFVLSLAKLFPKLYLVESNHGSLVYRRAKKFGIPAEYIKSYIEILFPNAETRPDWSWHPYLKVVTYKGELLFKHQHAGDLSTGAAHEGANLLVGHEHGKFGIGYRGSNGRQYWSVYAGCGVDEYSLAMAYGKNFSNKPILGCAVVVNGVPHVIPMILDEEGNWDKEVH